MLTLASTNDNKGMLRKREHENYYLFLIFKPEIEKKKQQTNEKREQSFANVNKLLYIYEKVYPYI